MTTHTQPPPPITPEEEALYQDLLNDHLTPGQVCQAHGLSVFQLADALESPNFQQVAAALARIHAARAAAILPGLRFQALQTLARIIQQAPTTPTQAETVRKAVGAILRWDKPAKAAEAKAEPEERPASADRSGGPGPAAARSAHGRDDPSPDAPDPIPGRADADPPPERPERPAPGRHAEPSDREPVPGCEPGTG